MTQFFICCFVVLVLLWQGIARYNRARRRRRAIWWGWRLNEPTQRYEKWL